MDMFLFQSLLHFKRLDAAPKIIIRLARVLAGKNWRVIEGLDPYVREVRFETREKSTILCIQNVFCAQTYNQQFKSYWPLKKIVDNRFSVMVEV